MAKDGILSGEIVIEIDHPKNNDLYFHPIGENVRSVVQHWRSGPGVKAPFVPITRIPGERIHVSVKEMRGRITDALGDPKNARILQQLKEAALTALGHDYKDPGDDRVTALRNIEDVHNWLYWMARWVECGWATKVQGDLKTAEEYQNGGDIRIPSTDLNVRRHEHGDSPYLKPTTPVKAAS